MLFVLCDAQNYIREMVPLGFPDIDLLASYDPLDLEKAYTAALGVVQAYQACYEAHGMTPRIFDSTEAFSEAF